VIKLALGENIQSVGRQFSAGAIYEEYGVEDARVTRIGDTFYITYVAVSRHGIATALASTTDFETFERHGIIFCHENKDVVLFTEKIDGKYVALHRPSSGFNAPEMWIGHSPDLVHWGNHKHLMGSDFEWGNERIGAGAPPVRISEGWLEIFHGNRKPEHEGEHVCYTAGAALLDAEKPHRVLKRSRGPLMAPKTDFETTGFVPNVVFPTGIIIENTIVTIYYGAADTVIGMAKFSLPEILSSLE